MVGNDVTDSFGGTRTYVLYSSLKSKMEESIKKEVGERNPADVR